MNKYWGKHNNKYFYYSSSPILIVLPKALQVIHAANTYAKKNVHILNENNNKCLFAFRANESNKKSLIAYLRFGCVLYKNKSIVLYTL